MQRVTTHDGKFDETSEEISLSNKWLNDVQHEIINVIEKEGIILNKDKNDQLNEAIDKKILKLSINTNNNGNEFFISKNVSNSIKVLKSDDLLKTSQEKSTLPTSREKTTGKWLSCSREINYNDAPDLNTFFNTSFDGLRDGSIPSKKHIAAKYDIIFTKLIPEIDELKNQVKTILNNNTQLANAENERKIKEQADLDKLKKDQDDLAAKQKKIEEDARKAEEARKAERENEQRRAEEARKAEAARKAEEKKKQDDAIKAAVEAERQRNAEAARRAEAQRERERQAERERKQPLYFKSYSRSQRISTNEDCSGAHVTVKYTGLHTVYGFIPLVNFANNNQESIDIYIVTSLGRHKIYDGATYRLRNSPTNNYISINLQQGEVIKSLYFVKSNHTANFYLDPFELKITPA